MELFSEFPFGLPIARNTMDFCMSVLCPATLLDIFTGPSRFFCGFLGIFCIHNHVMCRKREFHFISNFTASFLIFLPRLCSQNDTCLGAHWLWIQTLSVKHSMWGRRTAPPPWEERGFGQRQPEHLGARSNHTQLFPSPSRLQGRDFHVPVTCSQPHTFALHSAVTLEVLSLFVELLPDPCESSASLIMPSAVAALSQEVK